MNTSLASNVCPSCEHTPLTPFLECVDHSISGESFPIARCPRCQTAITLNVPDETQAGRYYQSDNYISHSNTAKGLVSKLYHAVRGYMLSSKRKLAQRVSSKKTGNILDIGSGTGYFLNEMKQNQWQTIGIEVSDNARLFSQQQFGLEVLPPKDLLAIPAESFDVVSLWHVLEHLYDLKGYLNKIKQVMKPEAVLLIAVPNYLSADGQHYGAFWAGFDVPRHLWHFSVQGMEKLMQQHGFQIIEKITMPFDPFYVALLSEKYKKNSFGLVSGFWQGFVSFLKGLANIQASSSVIYVIKKQ